LLAEEISRLNREEETKSMVEDMKKAEELIRIFSAMEGWTGKFQVHHSKQLTELEKAIENFFWSVLAYEPYRSSQWPFPTR
jgi:hypothetical protein